MNPYPERIEQLHAWLEDRFCQRDRQATEILLTALLQQIIYQQPRPRIIIETDWPSRDCANAWFSFGGVTQVASLAMPRVLHGYLSEEMLRGWLDSDQPRLMVEAEWRRLPSQGRGRRLLMPTSSYCTLLSQCVRCRVVHPKGSNALKPGGQAIADLEELRRLTGRVLDDSMRGLQSNRLRASHASVLAAGNMQQVPDSLLYWCELTQSIAPLQSDWESFTGSLIGIAQGIAILYDDGRDADWAAAERVLRDCIPWPTEQLLTLCRDSDPKGPNTFELWRRSGRDLDKVMKQEIARLAGAGVLAEVNNRELAWMKLLDRNQRLFAL